MIEKAFPRESVPQCNISEEEGNMKVTKTSQLSLCDDETFVGTGLLGGKQFIPRRRVQMLLNFVEVEKRGLSHSSPNVAAILHFLTDMSFLKREHARKSRVLVGSRYMGHRPSFRHL